MKDWPTVGVGHRVVETKLRAQGAMVLSTSALQLDGDSKAQRFSDLPKATQDVHIIAFLGHPVWSQGPLAPT